jgi:multidrug resistance efflux pump
MPSNLIEREFSKQLSQVHDPELLESDVEPLPNVNTRPATKTRLSWLRLGLLCIGLFGSFALGWWLATHQSQQQERISLPPSDAIIASDKFIVTSTRVRYRPVERFVEAVGTLHAFEEVTLSAKQEGRVLKIHHDLSSVVKPGEILLELDPTDAKLAYEQAERAVQTELAKWGFQGVPTESEDLQKLPTVVSARLKSELAQSRLQRMILLKATNAVSAEDLEQAKSDTLVQESEWQNQLLTAKSAAATARLRNAELAIANQRLQDISIRAPIPTATTNANDGFYTISERLVSEGTLVRSGTDVFKLVMGRTLKLKLSVPESYNGQVQVGQSVSITTGASESPSQGTVARISPVIDRSTRTFLQMKRSL